MTAARFSIAAWAKERGYERAIRSLTSNQVDELRAAIKVMFSAAEPSGRWMDRRDAASATIGRYVAILDKVRATTGEGA